MATIQIPDELLENLLAISREMRTQDRRCTASPYFYQIRCDKKVYDWGLNGDHKVLVDDEIEIETYKEMRKYLKENSIKQPKGFKAMWDDWYELLEFIEDNGISLKECSYSIEHTYENSFLTELACKAHIKMNHYHYDNPVDYVSHANRNPEMEIIQKFLLSLTETENQQ